MNANQTYEIWVYCLGKNLQQGYASPQNFYTDINSAQVQYLDYLLGEYQKYTPLRPVGTPQVGDGERMRNTISPLIYQTILAPNTTTGLANYPSDYEAVDEMWEQYGLYNVRFVNQPRLASFWGSSIDPITEQGSKIYSLRWEGIQFYPEAIGAAKMSYVRTPPSIVWGYTEDSNGIPRWNPATSQDPVWGDTDMFQIIARALRMAGVNLDSNVVNQYANEVKTIGQ